MVLTKDKEGRLCKEFMESSFSPKALISQQSLRIRQSKPTQFPKSLVLRQVMKRRYDKAFGFLMRQDHSKQTQNICTARDPPISTVSNASKPKLTSRVVGEGTGTRVTLLKRPSYENIKVGRSDPPLEEQNGSYQLSISLVKLLIQRKAKDIASRKFLCLHCTASFTRQGNLRKVSSNYITHGI
jgi:hypothetical protein